MFFKFRVRRAGAHAHVRVFAGENLCALGSAGKLTFRLDEWHVLTAALSRFSTPEHTFIVTDDTAAEPEYALPLDGVKFT